MHGGQFDQSGFFFVCRLSPTTVTLDPCPDEILACQWFHLQQILEDPDTTPFVRKVCALLQMGVRDGFPCVDISGQDTKSWLFPDKKYRFYHRTMQDE